MQKYNLLFIHPSGLFFGGTEKLLQIVAKNCTKDFNVYFAYSPQDGEQQKFFFDGTSVSLIPFDYTSKKKTEPYTLYGMQPGILDIVKKYRIHCVCLPAFAHYQFPVNVMPATMPIVLTSPFGHYCTNGNVRWVFVSGPSNWERLQRRGVKNSEPIFDPIEDFPASYLTKPAVSDRIVFGRVGRPDDNIFDSISTVAFARLERKFGNRVRYRVVGAPPKMKAMAQELGVRNMEFVDKFSPTFLAEFYQSIDVLAHARYDGETFGKAIAEAMLAGLPILTHKSRFHNEHLRLLDPAYAKWCEPDDVDAYYDNMEWFVHHPGAIRGMGQKARAYALEHFSPERQYPHIAAVFRSAAESCTFHEPGRVWKGYAVLWWNNLKKQPFVVAKRLVSRLPKLQALAIKLYSRI